MSLKVSVIIPTYNRLHDIKRALAALHSQDFAADEFQVIVVDDGCKDDTFKDVSAMAQAWKQLRILRQENAGPGVARNLGAASAQAPLLAFMDDDAVPEADWLQKSVDALEAHADWDGFEGAVLPQSEQEPELFVHQVANTKGNQWLTCNLWIRRQAFAKTGGFDPRYRWIREHTEFAFRALDMGLNLPFYSESVVRHPSLRINALRMLRDAKDGQYEALLQMTHPKRYVQHLKWIDGRAFPAYYLAHYAALLLLPLSRSLALAALIAGCAATLYAWCRKRRVSASAFLQLLPMSVFIPYLRLAWVAWGYLRYPKAPE